MLIIFLKHIEKRGTPNAYTQILIFDKCGKNKVCSYGIDDINNEYSGYGLCREKVKLVKIGKKCNLDEDCLTGLCIDNKCSGISENMPCTTKTLTTYPSSFCSTGLSCSPSSSGDYKCITLIVEAERDFSESNSDCGVGFGKTGVAGDNIKLNV